VSSTHEIGAPDRRAGTDVGKPVTVGDGCWIGARAVILPGVAVGDGCISAAGAVVTRDCQANGLCAGIPAKLIRHLGNHEVVEDASAGAL
jgi:maltose O-acetyltransferase